MTPVPSRPRPPSSSSSKVSGSSAKATTSSGSSRPPSSRLIDFQLRTAPSQPRPILGSLASSSPAHPCRPLFSLSIRLPLALRLVSAPGYQLPVLDSLPAFGFVPTRHQGAGPSSILCSNILNPWLRPDFIPASQHYANTGLTLDS